MLMNLSTKNGFIREESEEGDSKTKKADGTYSSSISNIDYRLYLTPYLSERVQFQFSEYSMF